jgi:hypothetical protein
VLAAIVVTVIVLRGAPQVAGDVEPADDERSVGDERSEDEPGYWAEPIEASANI